MQMLYNQHFPNARQHVTALPPLSKKHIEVNQNLQKLCSFTQSNFVSTNELRDEPTGRIRTGLTVDYHYNSYGLALVARAMMKSLFSTSNLQPKQLENMRMMLDAPDQRSDE